MAGSLRQGLAGPGHGAAGPAAGTVSTVGGRVAIATQDLGGHNGALAAELEAAALRVLRSHRYIAGGGSAFSEVRAFEDEAAAALGVSHAVGLSSGTDALLAMLMAVGVKPGDEVVTTPYSFFASAGAVARLGARPVFADVEPGTLNLDPVAASSRIGPRTRAVLTVHLFGRVARSEPLLSACAARGIPLLEDGAQAIGAIDVASGRRVGNVGRGAALSFFPSKNLGGFGDGGMLLTSDRALADAVRLLRTHGAAVKFHHTALGGNFRLDELQAALLRVKLPHLPAWTAARRRLAEQYRSQLRGLPLMLPPADGGCVWNQFVVALADGDRDALAAHLAGDGIGSAVYYPLPLHLQPCFASLGYRPGDLPVAERAAVETLALPIYPELTEEQGEQICASIGRFFSGSFSGSFCSATRLDSNRGGK